MIGEEETCAGSGRGSGFLIGILVAQFSAFTGALGGIMTEKLGDDGLPMVLSAGCYFLLGVVHGLHMLIQKGFHLGVPWWKYLIYATMDTGGSYFTLLSLKFTTVTSWALIQPSALLISVPLSTAVLHARFTWKHIASAALAVIGVVILILSDASTDDDEDDDSHSSKDLVVGDFIALFGVCMYTLSSILSETIAKTTDSTSEVLAMLGVFGFVISSIASAALGELSSDMFSDINALIYSCVVFVAHYFYYASAVVVFALSGTASLDVSLLGMNAWSVLGKITILGGFHPNPVFFPIALVTVILGVVLFASSGDPYEHHKKQVSLLEN